MFVLSSIIPDPSSSNFVFGRAAPAAINNQIVAFSRKANLIGLARWGIDGSFLSFDPCFSRPQTMLGSGVSTVDENGNVLVSISMKGNMSFSEDVTAHGNTANSNAVFAGRKLGNLVENGSQIPTLDLSPYSAGTYLVKINFARGVSVTRKVVKGE